MSRTDTTPPESTPRATLLVFTLGPDGDAQRHPLLPSRFRGLERDLRADCLATLLEAGRRCDLEIELSVASSGSLPTDVRCVRQRGRSFGERLTAAVDDAWSRRPSRPLVLVGGDTPQIDSGHLERALLAVSSDPDAVVVGPSRDGGFYLLAMSRPLEGVFERITWCRPTTRAELVRAIERTGRTVHLLETLVDLDRPRDLTGLLAERGRRASSATFATVWRVLSELARPPVPVRIDVRSAATLAPYAERAPPG